MPNWCECDLYIEGPKEKVEAFLSEVKTAGSLFDFDRIIPYPAEYRDADERQRAWEEENPGWPKHLGLQKERPKDGFNHGGYNWCVENWGTKWPAGKVVMGPHTYEWSEADTTHSSIELNFATAWDPPNPVIIRASAMFPELSFDLRYFEGGGMFNGRLACQAGRIIADERAKYFGRRGG